ncbi:MAG: NAD(P)H-hydrate dehydratase [Acutalibacteraceae bacterium]
MKILTTDLIKESEESAVQSGAFSFRELMYRAGNAAAEIIMQKYGCTGKKITVVCGRGNNGGDGCVIAGILAENGGKVTLCTPFGTPVTENAAYYYNELKFVTKTDIFLPDADIIIDAIFGIGLNRAPDEKTLEIIKAINGTDAVRISVDIPSGVQADSGRVLGAAINADLTVTFIAFKPCFVLPDGSDFCGETVVADIGAPPVNYSFLTTEKPIFKKRRHNSHKGTFGTGLMLCGSYGMAGAAILAAKAALRSGIGILKAALCEDIYIPFTVSVPEAVCVPLKTDKSGTLCPDNIDLPSLLKGCSAVLIGCGLGNNEDTAKIVRGLCEITDIPLIIDADGINALQGSIDIIKKSKAPIILTPHPGEMARLCSLTVREVEENRVEIAKAFAVKYGCVLVLKGANTIIALPSGELYFNMTGNPGMSTGGSGDALAGIILSLLAQGFSAGEAARAAVYLHGEAGDKAAARRGEHAMLPSDLIEEL